MLAIYTLSYIDRLLVGALAPLIKADLQLTDAQLGFANSTVFALFFVGFSIPLGWLADHYNRKRIIITALLLWSTFTMLFGMGRTVGHLVMARSGVGFGEAGGGSPTHSMLMDYFPKSQRARAMAIYGFGVPLGIALGAALGGWSSSIYGWRVTFVIAGGLGFFLSAVFGLTVREPKRITADGLPPKTASLLQSVKTMASKPAFIGLCGGVTCGGVVGFSKYFWITSFLVRSFGLSLVEVTSIFGLIQFVAGIGGAWVGGYLSDRLAAKHGPAAHAWVMSTAFVATIPMMCGLVLATTPTVAFVFLSAETFFNSFQNGPNAAAVQHLATPALRGTASSMLNVCLIAIAMGLGVPFVGALSDALLQRYGAESLRYALFSLPAFYGLGALSYMWAGRCMSGEKAMAVPAAS